MSPRRIPILARLSGAVALAGLCACPSAPRPVAHGPSVVVIAIDTLRADRLSCQGGRAGLTPRLDALAARSTRFSAAFAHASWTLPSFSSLFTSLPPEAHGAGGNVRTGWCRLDDEHVTLAERFRDAGWRTAAVVNVDFLTEPFGTVQGFDHVDARVYADNEHVRRAEQTTDAALAWIGERRTEPFLLLVHYFDPHAEYDPPKEWRARFARPEDQTSDAFRFGMRDHVVLHRNGRFEPDANMLARASALYDAEIAYVDHQVGRLLDGLAARGLDASTLVVVTSDHGEEFGDHGSWEHGHTLYDELLHVPLIVHVPGAPAAVVDAPVGLIDVAPSLCALAGVAPAPAFTGRNLAPLIRAGAAPPPAALGAYGSFWSSPLSSWRDGAWKLIAGGDAPELYDWRADPRERENLAGSAPDRAAALQAARAGRLRALGAGTPRPCLSVEVDAAAIDRLQGVGYTGGDGDR